MPKNKIKSFPFSIQQKIELHIDRLSHGGGRGVGRYEGVVVFVPNTAPEDKVLIEITAIKKSFAEAKLLNILEPSPFRREPPCPVATTCGGCTWQHIEYAEQLKQKQTFAERALNKFNKNQSFTIEKIYSSPSEFRYRNRIQLHYQNQKIGYYKKSSQDLVEINDCLIADPQLIEAIHEFKMSEAFMQTNPEAQRVEFALDLNNKIQVRHGKAKSTANLFSQVNTDQNHKLQGTVIDLLQQSQQNSPLNIIYDLYCGNGNLSLPLASKFDHLKVYGVDLSQSSIEAATKAASQLTNLKFTSQDTGKFLSNLEAQRNTLFILDPPRIGCDKKTINETLRIAPEFIIYVSCNLSTLTRDLEFLSNKYKINTVKLLDMFPQTDHMESIVWLERVSVNKP